MNDICPVNLQWFFMGLTKNLKQSIIITKNKKMKTKQTISKMLATAAMGVVGITASFAQQNIGASCGCPATTARTPVLMSSLVDHSNPSVEGNLLANTTLTCDKAWILDQKVYVPSGKTLTIMPGTVVYGVDTITRAANAVALTASVGGKIIADGTADCQIVFTAQHDPMDGSFPIANKGKWGGVLLAGRATNNLTKAANGPFQPGLGDGRLCVANGVGTFEGFASSDRRDQFGDSVAFDDNDNSGVLRYVSIRYAGAILEVGGEINGLSLGSVGRGTTIEHVEVVSAADDGMEFWGGVVNIKYYANLFGNDDNFDWDDGYSGKAQFIFALQCDPAQASPDSDNGFEMDADDQKSNLTPRSHPIIFNSTMIGNHKTSLTSDNSGLAAMEAKELTEGEISNSIFANFRYGLNLIKSMGTRTGSSEAYHNWANTGGNGSNSLKIKCNTFVNCVSDIAIDKNGTGGTISSTGVITGGLSTTDTAQFFTTDKNKHVSSIAGFDYVFTVNGATNAISHKVDVIPSTALSSTGCPTPPTDGFFTPTNYRGAFPTGQVADGFEQMWLSGWSYSKILGVTGGLVTCASDTNADGVINVTDFLKVLGDFGTSCN